MENNIEVKMTQPLKNGKLSVVAFRIYGKAWEEIRDKLQIEFNKGIDTLTQTNI